MKTPEKQTITLVLGLVVAIIILLSTSIVAMPTIHLNNPEITQAHIVPVIVNSIRLLLL